MSQLTRNSTVAEVLVEIDREHEEIVAALGELTGEWTRKQKDLHEELVEDRLEMAAARSYLMRKCRE